MIRRSVCLTFGLLLTLRPVIAWAQSGPQPGTMLDRRPFKADAFAPARTQVQVQVDGEPQVDQSGTPPDNAVIMSPLAPPEPGGDTPDQTEEMVPNPLDGPAVQSAPPGRGTPKTPVGQIRRGTWVQMGTASLQALDKVNARVETLVVKAGDVGHFGSLEIAVKGCFVRPPDQPADATAFLTIRDQRAGAPAGGTVFAGWVVRSVPYMSMMAHPIYDVRVAGCTP